MRTRKPYNTYSPEHEGGQQTDPEAGGGAASRGNWSIWGVASRNERETYVGLPSVHVIHQNLQPFPKLRHPTPRPVKVKQRHMVKNRDDHFGMSFTAREESGSRLWFLRGKIETEPRDWFTWLHRLAAFLSFQGNGATEPSYRHNDHSNTVATNSDFFVMSFRVYT